MIEQIRSEAEKFLKSNSGAILLGYVPAAVSLSSVPVFVRDPAATKNLVFDHFSSANLAVYLPKIFKKGKKSYPPKVGIIAKGCDGRSIVNLINEKQARREDLFIIGVSCSGIVSRNKVAQTVGKEVVSSEEKDGMILLTLADGSKTEPQKDECLFDSCKECNYPIPPLYDILIGEEREVKKTDGVYKNIADFEARTPAERWRKFTEEMKKCIRCSACRQACPNCYCITCFAEQNNPSWIGVTTDLSDTMLFHIGRILHQTGRCVDCSACVRACPMGVDLRLFTRKIVKDAEYRFGHTAGLTLGEPSPLNTYLLEDAQEFIVEP